MRLMHFLRMFRPIISTLWTQSQRDFLVWEMYGIDNLEVVRIIEEERDEAYKRSVKRINKLEPDSNFQTTIVKNGRRGIKIK